MFIKKLFISFFLLFFASSSIAEEKTFNDQSNEISFFTGTFDYSDHGKRSTLFGFEHQNENLNRDTFLGNLSPVTGFLITVDNAGYLYTGVEAQYKLGSINFIFRKTFLKLFIIYNF